MLGGNFPIHDDPREVVRRLAAERGEDLASLSRLIGRNVAYIQQFVTRGTPKRLPERERRVLARHFGVPEEWLGAEPGTLGQSPLVTPPPLDEGQKAPSLAFSPERLKRLGASDAATLRLGCVTGDAMTPTLHDGDDILVDPGDGRDRLRDGLYLIRIDGCPQVRRLMLHPVAGAITVQADNPDYADWAGVEREALDIVGRLVWAGRRLA